MKFKQFFSPDLGFFFLILIILVLSAGGHIVSGDEETMYRVTQTIVEGKGLAVSREEIILPAQNDNLFIPSQDETIWTTSAVPGRDGQTYSKYGIGQSLVAIPLYVFGDLLENLILGENNVALNGWFARLFVSMLNPIALAGLAWLMVVFGRALGYRTTTSRWIAAAFIFTSMAWPYVNTFYPQPSVAFLVMGAFFSAYKWRTTQEQKWLWFLSAASGVAVLFRLSAILILPVLILYLIKVSPKQIRWRWIAPMTIGIGAAGFVTAWYNWLRFGSFFETGYHEIAWTNPPIYGLYGLLFSPGKGILFYAPMLVLSLVGSLLFIRKNKPELWLIIGLWISYLSFYAAYNFWTGGFNWGPRFLLPLLALAFVPLGALLENETVRGTKLVFTVFFIVGFLIQFPAVIVDHSRYLYQKFDETGDPSMVYGETIQTLEASPILQQWPTALDLVRAYFQAEAWEKAEKSVKIITDSILLEPNLQALLYSEFFRRNTVDFWWLNLRLLTSN